MADNTKYVARVPIVPDDFENKDLHKNHELVMDFNTADIYIKDGNSYINITGQIKESIKKIQDGSAVIHIVTEDTLPSIEERSRNHWYYVITRAEDSSGDSIATANYIYYGTIQSYYTTKNYLLISQNTTIGTSQIKFIIDEGYSPCLYIPTNMSATFTNADTGENIDFEIKDRLYAINTLTGSYIAYDVYILGLYDPGTYLVDMEVTGSDRFNITFDTNEPSIEGLVLPDPISVKDGNSIGAVPDPTWDDPRFEFLGWSSSRLAYTEIDPEIYIPEYNMTIYAWFEYNSDNTLFGYFVDAVSGDEEGNGV